MFTILVFIRESRVDMVIQIPNSFRVRIAYLGRMLREQDSLLDQGWQSGHVVNAMIASRTSMSP